MKSVRLSRDIQHKKIAGFVNENLQDFCFSLGSSGGGGILAPSSKQAAFLPLAHAPLLCPFIGR
jgi:hypothetical protein